MGLKLIRANLNPEVTARQDVILFHDALGEADAKTDLPETGIRSSRGGGIFKDLGNEFNLSLTSSLHQAKMQSGVGALYGRQFELPGNETVDFDFSAIAGNAYIIIYVEVNTLDPTNETASITSVFAQGSWPSIQSDNLYKIEQGIARMELYRIRKTFVSGSTFRYDVTSQRAFYRPGVAQDVAKLNSRYVEDIVNDDHDSVKMSEGLAGLKFIRDKGGILPNKFGLTFERYVARPSLPIIPIFYAGDSEPSAASIEFEMVTENAQLAPLRINFKFGIRKWNDASTLLPIDYTYEQSYDTGQTFPIVIDYAEIGFQDIQVTGTGVTNHRVYLYLRLEISKTGKKYKISYRLRWQQMRWDIASQRYVIDNTSVLNWTKSNPPVNTDRSVFMHTIGQ